MPTRPARIIDAHVHFWDPARTDWYPYLSGLTTGAMSRMGRRFDAETYAAESSGWNVEKVVHVAAATGHSSVEEALELDRAAAGTGRPDAVIGGLPPTGTTAEAVALIDRQAAADRFRGVRPMGGLDRPVPEPEVLRALQERGLVFELLAHPDQLQEAAVQLAGFDDLAIVVEHVGWPRSDSDDERRLWQQGLAALAGIGDHVTCKLSGLAMALRSLRADALAPWIEPAIERFGVDRCLFASNFPVDSVAGTFDDLYEAFSTVTRGFDAADRDKLFAANAERVYRL